MVLLDHSKVVVGKNILGCVLIAWNIYQDGTDFWQRWFYALPFSAVYIICTFYIVKLINIHDILSHVSIY